MKKEIFFLSLFLFLFVPSNATAGETSVKVDITQEGSGTSSVKINGEEWKLEGPGEIHVDKTSSETSKPSVISSSKPSPTPEPTPTITSDNQTSAINQILNKLEEIKEVISNFLNQIF